MKFIFILTVLLTQLSVINLEARTFTHAEARELLFKHRPILFTTNKEFSPPVGVESMLENSYLVDESQNNVIRGADGAPLRPGLQDLKKYNEEHYSLKLKKDYTRLYGDSDEENYNNSKPVVYARLLDLPSENLISLQYFFFYPGSYTGKLLVPMQLAWHEGDTEFAQIMLNRSTLKPVGASVSIHYYGQSEPRSKLLVGEDGRIKMYVAQKSHATYLAPAKGRGHQAMVGNLGFGGDLMVSLKTVWDPAREDREVDYELQIPQRDSMIFHWKGKWGGKEDLLSGYKGARNREAGVPSFAYRNALSDRLSMYNDPAGYFYFYYLPSPFYQKLVLNLKEIKEERVQSELFELIKKIGRLRAKVDSQLQLDRRYSDRQKTILAEAVPFVVLAARKDFIRSLYNGASKVMGKAQFLKLANSIAKSQLKTIASYIAHLDEFKSQYLKTPLDLFLLSPEVLTKVLSKLTELEETEIVNFYRGSNASRIGDQLYIDLEEQLD